MVKVHQPSAAEEAAALGLQRQRELNVSGAIVAYEVRGSLFSVMKSWICYGNYLHRNGATEDPYPRYPGRVCSELFFCLMEFNLCVTRMNS